MYSDKSSRSFIISFSSNNIVENVRKNYFKKEIIWNKKFLNSSPLVWIIYKYKVNENPSLVITISVSFVFETWTRTYRDRFPICFPRRYCVPAWMFSGVPGRLHELFRSVVPFLWPENLRNGQERLTFWNSQGSWTVWNVHTMQDKWSEAFAESRSIRKKHCT